MIHEKDITQATLKNIALEMVIAARTAPKGRGLNNIEICLVEGEEIKALSAKMKEIGHQYSHNAFLRDADNILASPIIILMGSIIQPLGLKKCGMCGFKDCEEKSQYKNIPCVFNTGDLGIAIGSAASIAMDKRVDNRIMYTVGQAAMELKLFTQDIKIAYGIPLSATSKNPFFDRKPPTPKPDPKA
ncbi:MAG: DUF2148 domain-containing protein [Candidatus Omnitrophica bacterium]|nr:DUF2148 domain-containing protein [Candidatus Omnitrophota bacterium]